MPLGGNRHGKIATARNLMLTMLLGGLWHGANWTFVFWGGLHGLGLIARRTFAAWRKNSGPAPRVLRPAIVAVSVAATFAWVALAWIFFRAASFSVAAAMLAAFTRPSLPTIASWRWFALAMVGLALVHLATYLANLKTVTQRARDWLFAFCYGAAIAAVLPLVNIKVVPFIYF